MEKHDWLTIGLLMLFLSSLTPISCAASGSDDWPMFRGNPERSGSTPSNATANSAQLIWKYPTSASVISSPAIADGVLVFGCKDCYIYCVNASSGKLIWEFKVAHEVSSPAICKGKVWRWLIRRLGILLEPGQVVFCMGQIPGQVLSSLLVADDRVTSVHHRRCFMF